MTLPFERALGDELLAAAHRDQRRRRRRRVAGLGAGLAAIVTAVVAAVAPNPAAADIEVTIRNGEVRVRIVGNTTSAEEVAAELHDEGVEVRVAEVPSGPSNVGRFVSVLIDGPDADRVRTFGEDGASFTGFVIPEDWDGELTITVGRQARDGEPYDAGADLFAEGEPLRCAGVLGLPLREALAKLDDDVRVRVQQTEGGMLLSPPVPVDEALSGPNTDWYLVGGVAMSQVDMILQTASAPPPPEDGC